MHKPGHIETLSDDEVIRMIERLLAAIFERIRRPSHSYSLSLALSVCLYIYMLVISMTELVLGVIFEYSRGGTRSDIFKYRSEYPRMSRLPFKCESLH